MLWECCSDLNHNTAMMGNGKGETDGRGEIGGFLFTLYDFLDGTLL